MRILHCVNSLDRGNGISNAVVDLSVLQARNDHSVCVVGNRGSYSDFIEDFGVTSSSVDFADRNALKLIQSRKKLRSAIREFHPDVIHCHTITPLVLVKSLLLEIPVVATVHNEWQRSSDIMRMADCVVGVSPSVTESMGHRGVPENRLRTVSNGTTGSPRLSIESTPVTLQHPAVLYVGSLQPRKGTDILLRAISTLHQRISDAHLYLVGNNDLPITQEMLIELGIEDAVTLVGLADPFPYYAEADVFVLPSRREAAGLVLLEAMAEGLPVIGSRVGGIEDSLDGKGGGLTFHSEDDTELGRLLVEVLEDSDFRTSLSQRARQVSLRHSVESVYCGYQSIYSELATQMELTDR